MKTYRQICIVCSGWFDIELDENKPSDNVPDVCSNCIGREVYDEADDDDFINEYWNER